MFDDMNNDMVAIEYPDGRRSKTYKVAMTRDRQVYIYDGSLDVEEGYILIQTIPSQKEIRYVISSVDYSNCSISGEYFVLSIEREGRAKPAPQSSSGHTINISNSHGIQIGDYNSMTLQLALGEILQRIDDSDSSREDREEAKSRLTEFLAHPLVAAVVGAGLPSALGLLN